MENENGVTTRGDDILIGDHHVKGPGGYVSRGIVRLIPPLGRPCAAGIQRPNSKSVQTNPRRSTYVEPVLVRAGNIF